MEIRKATLKDVDKIVELWNQFQDDHDEIVISKSPELKEYVKRKSDAKESYKKHITNNLFENKGVIFLAVDDGIIGFTFGWIKDEIPIYEIEKYGLIGDFYVKKENMGKSSKSGLGCARKNGKQ